MLVSQFCEFATQSQELMIQLVVLIVAHLRPPNRDPGPVTESCDWRRTEKPILFSVSCLTTGIIQNTEPPRLDSPAPLEAGQPATTTNSTLTEKPARNTRRRKRFDYEDTYEWEDDDDLTYEVVFEPSQFGPCRPRPHWRTCLWGLPSFFSSVVHAPYVLLTCQAAVTAVFGSCKTSFIVPLCFWPVWPSCTRGISYFESES